MIDSTGEDYFIKQLDSAYDERNNVVLFLAAYANRVQKDSCGYYVDTKGEEGFTRVISLLNGKYTFHVPDSMDLGSLPLIAPNWNGHTTAEKYDRMRRFSNN